MMAASRRHNVQWDGLVYDNGVWCNGCTPKPEYPTYNFSNRMEVTDEWLGRTNASELLIETPLVIEEGKIYDIYEHIVYQNAAGAIPRMYAFDANELADNGTFVGLLPVAYSYYRSPFAQDIADAIELQGYYTYYLDQWESNRQLQRRLIGTSSNAGKQICLYTAGTRGIGLSQIKIDII